MKTPRLKRARHHRIPGKFQIRREDGQAFLTIIVVLTVIMVAIPVAAYLQAVNLQPITSSATLNTIALQSAQAGVTDFENRLASDPTYGESISGWSPAPSVTNGSTSTYPAIASTGYCSTQFEASVAAVSGYSNPYACLAAKTSASATSYTGGADPSNPGFVNYFDGTGASGVTLPGNSSTNYANGSASVKTCTTTTSSTTWANTSKTGATLVTGYQYVLDSHNVYPGSTNSIAYLFVTGRAGTLGNFKCQTVKTAISMLATSSNSPLSTQNTWTITPPVPAVPATVTATITGATGGNGNSQSYFFGLIPVAGGSGGLGESITSTFSIPASSTMSAITGQAGSNSGTPSGAGTYAATGGAGGPGGGSGGGATILCYVPSGGGSCAALQSAGTLPVCTGALSTDNSTCVAAIAGGGGGGGSATCLSTGANGGTGGGTASGVGSILGTNGTTGTVVTLGSTLSYGVALTGALNNGVSTLLASGSTAATSNVGQYVEELGKIGGSIGGAGGLGGAIAETTTYGGHGDLVYVLPLNNLVGGLLSGFSAGPTASGFNAALGTAASQAGEGGSGANGSGGASGGGGGGYNGGGGGGSGIDCDSGGGGGAGSSWIDTAALAPSTSASFAEAPVGTTSGQVSANITGSSASSDAHIWCAVGTSSATCSNLCVNESGVTSSNCTATVSGSACGSAAADFTSIADPLSGGATTGTVYVAGAGGGSGGDNDSTNSAGSGAGGSGSLLEATSVTIPSTFSADLGCAGGGGPFSLGSCILGCFFGTYNSATASGGSAGAGYAAGGAGGGASNEGSNVGDGAVGGGGGGGATALCTSTACTTQYAVAGAGGGGGGNADCTTDGQPGAGGSGNGTVSGTSAPGNSGNASDDSNGGGAGGTAAAGAAGSGTNGGSAGSSSTGGTGGTGSGGEEGASGGGGGGGGVWGAGGGGGDNCVIGDAAGAGGGSASATYTSSLGTSANVSFESGAAGNGGAAQTSEQNNGNAGTGGYVIIEWQVNTSAPPSATAVCIPEQDTETVGSDLTTGQISSSLTQGAGTSTGVVLKPGLSTFVLSGAAGGAAYTGASGGLGMSLSTTLSLSTGEFVAFNLGCAGQGPIGGGGFQKGKPSGTMTSTTADSYDAGMVIGGTDSNGQGGGGGGASALCLVTSSTQTCETTETVGGTVDTMPFCPANPTAASAPCIVAVAGGGGGGGATSVIQTGGSAYTTGTCTSAGSVAGTAPAVNSAATATLSTSTNFPAQGGVWVGTGGGNSAAAGTGYTGVAGGLTLAAELAGGVGTASTYTVASTPALYPGGGGGGGLGGGGANSSACSGGGSGSSWITGSTQGSAPTQQNGSGQITIVASSTSVLAQRQGALNNVSWTGG